MKTSNVDRTSRDRGNNLQSNGECETKPSSWQYLRDRGDHAEADTVWDRDKVDDRRNLLRIMPRVESTPLGPRNIHSSSAKTTLNVPSPPPTRVTALSLSATTEGGRRPWLGRQYSSDERPRGRQRVPRPQSSLSSHGWRSFSRTQ